MHGSATTPHARTVSRSALRRIGLSLTVAGLTCASLLWTQVAATRADTASEAALAVDLKVLDEAKSNSDLMTNLTHLSDIIGPRLTGSAALKRANEWAAEKMK